MFTSCWLQDLPPGGFENGDDVLALHAGKALQKILDGIACLKVVEETLDRDASANEYGRPPQDLRVAMNEGFETHAEAYPWRHRFASRWSSSTANGSGPAAALVLGNDGNFYGTTYEGGSGIGTVFRLIIVAEVQVLTPSTSTLSLTRSTEAGGASLPIGGNQV
jgi:uncharacterized repeat protein (TIGR03803 family)